MIKWDSVSSNQFTHLDNLDYYITTQPNTTVNPNYSFHSPTSTLKVQGEAEFESDVKIKGKSILETLEAIEDRLAILQPDPKKLAKYEALKKAYDHYKLMEKLIGEDE